MKAEKAVFGRPYIVVAIPVFDEDGTVVGGVAVSEPTDTQGALKENTSRQVEDVEKTVSRVAEAIQRVSVMSVQLDELAEKLGKEGDVRQ